ncbi:MAG TPA: hypothetical protein VJZ03_03210 [Candidatus Bathyarchaeia archaeon]|nr:hypothetical protein [Candidatus Bathyarchaeia archaeon]
MKSLTEIPLDAAEWAAYARSKPTMMKTKCCRIMLVSNEDSREVFANTVPRTKAKPEKDVKANLETQLFCTLFRYHPTASRSVRPRGVILRIVALADSTTIPLCLRVLVINVTADFVVGQVLQPVL